MEKDNKKILDEIMYNLETDEVLEIFNKPKEIRSIKNEPKKTNNTKYKSRMLKTRIKALAAAALIASGIGVAGQAIHNAGYNEGYDKGFNEATAYSHMSNEDIESEIEDILIGEYTKATGAEKEEVHLDYRGAGSDATITEISDNDKSFHYTRELEGTSTGNLKAKKYRNLISKYAKVANSGASKRELIDLLKKTKEFSKQKDLEIENDKLKEVKAKDDDNER